MYEASHARLCFLTSIEGKVLLNLTVPQGEQVFDENGFARIQITRDHVAGLVLNGVPLLVGEMK